MLMAAGSVGLPRRKFLPHTPQMIRYMRRFTIPLLEANSLFGFVGNTTSATSPTNDLNVVVAIDHDVHDFSTTHHHELTTTLTIFLLFLARFVECAVVTDQEFCRLKDRDHFSPPSSFYHS